MPAGSVRGGGVDRVAALVAPSAAARLDGFLATAREEQLAGAQVAHFHETGMPERRTHDYVRHGTTTLFAALNVADATVISSLHRRHRTVEFTKFLAKIDTEVLGHLDVHVIADNYGTHKSPTIGRWLAAHPRFHLHFTHPDLLLLDQPGRTPLRLRDSRPAPTQRPPQRPSPRSRPAHLGQSLERQPQALHLDQDRRADPAITRTTSPTDYRRGTLACLFHATVRDTAPKCTEVPVL
jgi:hypothetical protein